MTASPPVPSAPASPTTRTASLPLRIGLTGGIASGKSTVAELFAAQSIPVLDADGIARDVVAPGTALLGRVIERFGAPLRRADGSLDRAHLRRIVFADATARADLEALLHPAIRERTEALAAAAGGPYQIHMLPLLVETDARSRYDRILVVDCDEAAQRQRLMSRDGIDAAEADAMLAAQASRSARRAVADDIIDNTAAPQALPAQVAALHRRYLALAAGRSA